MPQGTTSFARLEGEGGAAVVQTVRATLGRLRAGEPLHAGKLTLIPLLPVEEDVAHATGYLPLESAVAQQVMTVTEKPAATVPELVVSSTAEAPVLMICGEQVIGGLQNRVFNTTMLVAAHATLDVPVTCVEMGRWHGTGAHGYGRARRPGDAPERVFSSAEPAYARMRAKHMSYVTKSLTSEGSYASDQGEVWSEVAERMSATGVSSGTSAMRAMYAEQERSSSMDETVAQLPRPEGALGFVAVVASKPVGGEIFTDDALAGAYWPRLTRSYAMDALDNVWSKPATEPDETETSGEGNTPAADATNVEEVFLAGALAAEIQAYISPGLGSDVRLAGAELAGAGLVHEGTLVHLSLFPTEEEGTQAATPQQP